MSHQRVTDVTVKRKNAMCIDSRASETDVQKDSDRDSSLEIADALDEAFRAALLETADDELEAGDEGEL